jgi:hypothetical protein
MPPAKLRLKGSLAHKSVCLGLYTRVDKKVVNGLPVWKDASGADRGSSPSMVLRGCVSLRHHLARPMAGSNS